MPWFAELLGEAAAATFAVLPLTDPSFTTFPSPGDLVDVELDMEGNLYFLRSGTPHLEVHSREGDVTRFDLPQVMLPGGLCLEDRWGWWVSDSMDGMSYRYDASGTVVDSLYTPDRPGDICELGLSLLYVSRDRGAVMDARQPVGDRSLLRLSGACLGQLSASNDGAVYSDGSESFMVPVLGEPTRLPGAGTWDLVYGVPVLLRGDSLLTDSWKLEVPGASSFTRLSSSPGGRFMVLWIPGGEEVLVSR